MYLIVEMGIQIQLKLNWIAFKLVIGTRLIEEEICIFFHFGLFHLIDGYVCTSTNAQHVPFMLRFLFLSFLIKQYHFVLKVCIENNKYKITFNIKKQEAPISF